MLRSVIDMASTELYKKVRQINEEILASLKSGDIETTLTKLRERDDCMQGGLSKLEDDLIHRNEVLPILEEIIKQDNIITEMLNEKITNLKSSLTGASGGRKLRKNYTKKVDRDEPRFLDHKG